MKKMLIERAGPLTRGALLEDGKIIELYIEKDDEKNVTGNIYAARVENVLPGMNAAFVNIGEEKNAFYHYNKNRPPLKKGDSVLVQAVKDSIHQKGAAVTDKISLPGRFTVLIANSDSIGISKKIEDDSIRSALKNLVSSRLPEGFGAIIRTKASSVAPEEIEKEIHALYEQWALIAKKSEYMKPPCLIKKEIGVIEKALFRYASLDLEQCVINDKNVYDAFKEKDTLPKSVILTLYEEEIPLFKNYFIESQIEKALQKKVWLKSGGFVVIEQTEACVVIDVNTGKYTGKKDTGATFLQTNIEAAKEIAKQLRLRNLYGIVIIDFIDMKNDGDKKAVMACLEDETNRDPVKTVVVSMTELGLAQLTRKKTRKSIYEYLTYTCAHCGGNGFARYENAVNT